MLDTLIHLKPDQRRQALAMMSLSPEAIRDFDKRVQEKKEAIKNKDAEALRKILEREKAEINALLVQYGV